MTPIDWFSLLHPVLVILFVYPVVGATIRLGILVREKRLGITKQPAPVPRWTSTPVSAVEGSVHDTDTDVLDVAEAANPVGADGAVGVTVPRAPKTSAVKEPEPENDSTRSCLVPDTALATPTDSNRPGAAQLTFVDSSMQRLIATTVPAGLTR